LKVICPKSIGLGPGDYVAENCDNGFVVWKDNEVWERHDQTLKKYVQQAQWLFQINSTYSEYEAELAEGIKPEDARYVLPNATKTEIATTFNLRQWRHVFQERALNRHAQWEIRGIFSSIFDDLKGRFPAVFADLEGDNE
jgi:flavin-dependent thymidylate synthase